METTNLYYHTVFRRSNKIRILILSFFLAISNWPRLILEVFIRKDFGERYFSLSSSIIVFCLLSGFPFIFKGPFNTFFTDGSLWFVIKTNLDWYFFIGAFMVMSVFRYREVARNPSTFNMERFSLSTGLINHNFYKVKIPGITADPRSISTLFEPAFFLAIGLLLLLVHSNVGGLIVFCSIIYSLSYFGAYKLGDEFILDKIDEIICTEELVKSFVERLRPEETRGFTAFGRMPDDPIFARRVVDTFVVKAAADVF